MASKYLHRKRLLPVASALATVALLWWLFGLDSWKNVAITLVGAVLGGLVGLADWRRIRQRIYAGNRITLYTTDSFVYALMVGVAMSPLSAPLGMAYLVRGLDEWRGLLIVGLLGLASFGLGRTLAIYGQIRRHELRHGPLQTRYIHSGSTSGAEGMMGTQTVVRTACAPEGTVRVRNEIWKARALDSSPLEVGETVTIRELDGLTLLVERSSGTVS